MKNTNKFNSDAEDQWCPGCPNHGILEAFKKALVELGKEPNDICLVSGIGQAAKLPHYLKCNFFNGLHGRAIPVATGLKVANPELTTIVVTGEGDCYGEGGNHFIHGLRRNPDITVVIHNNEIYALTKGQASPTTPLGAKRSLQSDGVEIKPLNMPRMAIQNGCGFVARGFAGDVDHLKDLLINAINYRGFSYIDIIQPCITWVKKPLKWYKERIRKLNNEHDPGDRLDALKKAEIIGDKVNVGILYQAPSEKTFAEKYRETYSKDPFAKIRPVKREKISEILGEYKAFAS
jgi:2-oxoglutarate ferredoxin oxidoreductase subunit beta